MIKKDNIFTTLLSLYCLLLPFEYVFSSSVGSINRILAVGIIAYVWTSHHARRISSIVFSTHGLLIAWLIFMALSIFWISSFDWWKYFIEKYVLQIILLVTCGIVNVEEVNVQKIKKALIYASVLASIILVFFPISSSLDYEGRRTLILFGNKIDPNILAATMLLGIQLSYGELFEGKKSIWMVAVVVLFNIYGMLMTGSRGAVIALIFGLIVEVFFRLNDAESKKKARIVLILGIVAAFAIVLILPEDLLSARFSGDALFGLNEFNNGSHNRYTIWTRAFVAFANKPIFGYGCGNFFYAISTVYRECASHNLYVLLLVEGGIFGFALFGLYLIKIWKLLRRSRLYSLLGLLSSVLAMSISLDALTYKYFWMALIYCWLVYREKISFENSLEKSY